MGIWAAGWAATTGDTCAGPPPARMMFCCIPTGMPPLDQSMVGAADATVTAVADGRLAKVFRGWDESNTTPSRGVAPANTVVAWLE